jgi:tellurite resistance protein
MTNLEKLYETLGELLYVIAMSDGVIQPEERKALETLLQQHTWASTINWSFNYEEQKGADVKDIYNKVINYCHKYGPTPVYEEFIDAMQFVAGSANGVEASEEAVISSFSKDLIARFRRDVGITD